MLEIIMTFNEHILGSLPIEKTTYYYRHAINGVYTATTRNLEELTIYRQDSAQIDK